MAGAVMHAPPISSRTVSTLLAMLLVTIAAIIFDPARTPHPLTTGDGRGYLILVAAIAVGVAIWRIRSGTGERMRPIAAGVLITCAPALFLIGRVRLLPILVVLALAVVIAFVESRTSHANGTATQALLIAVPLLVWLSLAGATSLETEGRLLYPLVALVAGTAAVWLAWNPEDQLGSGALALTTGVIGMELAVASSYLNISPYVEASLVLIALALVASCYLVVLRGTAP